ncbi:MAG TPA: DUF350 domain-containing protein [Solirubrobacteraceae bacterium]|nr:DUF350 domain-containing protein [Solirubrobacteraceae bacterium]
MLELVGQVLAYSGVGLVVLVAGFFVIDALTPGKLGALVMDGNPNAAMLAATTLVSLGLILWFAIFFTGAGWSGLDDALVYGAVGVGAQAVGFVVLDLLTPGKLNVICGHEKLHPASFVSAAVQLSVALVVCASLT